MKRRPVGVPWWGEVCLSVRTPWDRAYSAGVLSCIGALARAPERELVRRSEGCWCQGGPLWPAETLCFTYPQRNFLVCLKQVEVRGDQESQATPLLANAE